LPEFIKARKFNYHFVVDRDTLTFSAFGVSVIPKSFLIDADNIIQWVGHSRDMNEAIVKEFLATGKVKEKEFVGAFDISRYDSLPANVSSYTLVVVDRSKLLAHRSLLVGHTSDSSKGSYSNAPQFDGVLTCINYDLQMLTERTAAYFKHLKLQCNIGSVQGYDFIRVPFDSFSSMNGFLRREYGIVFRAGK
jgi:hypothetical protein